MGIVNAGRSIYEEIDPDLLERVEDVLLNRRADATDRLTEFADGPRAGREGRAGEDLAWRERPSRSGSSHALVAGHDVYIVEDTEEARHDDGPAARSSRGR